LAKKKMGIVGSGIIGLGAALKCLQEGHEVVIYSDQKHFIPTSPVAAAFWFPYACSLTLEEEIALAEPTHAFLSEAGRDKNAGVVMKKGRAYFDDTVEESEIVTPWWARLESQFRQLKASDIPNSLLSDPLVGPIHRGWEFEVPVVHIPTFLQWLTTKIHAFGGEFVNARIESFSDFDKSLHAVLNCTGGWATHITTDPSLVAYQGTVAELAGEPLGSDLIFLEKGKSSDLPTYIVPQGSRTIIGGTLKQITQPGERWKPGVEGAAQQWRGTSDEIRGIVERCRIVSGVSQSYPLQTISEWNNKTGLRPVRVDLPPRIEVEENAPIRIVHNYGHGGSGITLFWGSALEAYRLAVG
jgi:D-amino-acid oxidase